MKEHDLIPKHADAMHPSFHLELGDCGMGMPVIRTWQAIKKLNPGEILQLSSSHPCVEPDLKAWCRSSGNQLVQIILEGNEKHFYVKKT